MKKPIYYVLIGVLLLVFCFSAFQIANYFIKGREKANQFDELSQLASQFRVLGNFKSNLN